VKFYTEINTTNYIQWSYFEAHSRSHGQQILLFLKANVSCVLTNPKLYSEVGYKTHPTVLLPAWRRYFDIIAIVTSRSSKLFLSFIFLDCKCEIVESWRSSTPSSLPVPYDFASRAHFFLFNLITLILFTYKLLKLYYASFSILGTLSMKVFSSAPGSQIPIRSSYWERRQFNLHTTMR